MEGWLLVDNSSASSGFDQTIENGETRKAEATTLFIFDEMSRCLKLSKAYQQAGRERGVSRHIRGRTAIEGTASLSRERDESSSSLARSTRLLSPEPTTVRSMT
jgi:hypothetical protein